MIKGLLVPTVTISFAILILIISLFNASEISYDIADVSSPLPLGPYFSEQYYVNYDLPEASSTPMPVINQLRAAGDKLKIMVSISDTAKAEMMLDNANRRMVMGEIYIREGKINSGLVAINKAQKYMEEALTLLSNQNTPRSNAIMKEIGIASLKHREILERIIALLPDESRTFLVSNIETSKIHFENARAKLLSYGEVPPISPFEGN